MHQNSRLLRPRQHPDHEGAAAIGLNDLDLDGLTGLKGVGAEVRDHSTLRRQVRDF
jgi:hypothetical protein